MGPRNITLGALYADDRESIERALVRSSSDFRKADLPNHVRYVVLNQETPYLLQVNRRRALTPHYSWLVTATSYAYGLNEALIKKLSEETGVDFSIAPTEQDRLDYQIMAAALGIILRSPDSFRALWRVSDTSLKSQIS